MQLGAVDKKQQQQQNEYRMKQLHVFGGMNREKLTLVAKLFST